MGISIIEDRILNIDKFQLLSGDKAYYKGHFYSDKAPGLTFLALPSIAASIKYLNTLPEKPKWSNHKNQVTSSFILVTQIATIFTSGLLTALTAVGLFFIAVRLGAGLGGATFGALTYGLATPAWGWATAFFGHAAAASCLFLGLVAVIYLLDSPKSRNKEILLSFSAGALLSWAIVVEYTSAPASAIIALYAIYNAWGWERGRFLRLLTSAGSGAFLFILPLLIYNYAIYENLFTSGYRYHATFIETKDGFYGIGSPKARIVGRLLLGIKRGILWLSPLLIFAPYALYRQWKVPGQRGLALIIILIVVYYFLWNSGYVYWTAGSATGPRFLTPILPFICLSLAILWSRAGNYLRGGLILFFVMSFLISLISVSVSMMGIRTPNTNIVFDHLLPNFVDGSKLRISYVVKSISNSFDGTSLVYLFPLFFILIVTLAYILWELKREKYRQNVAKD